MGTYIILAIVLVLVILAILKVIRDKKNGSCCGCKGNCSGCNTTQQKKDN